ncbi:MAG: hypothetical protein FJW34_03110 [Acidobacteria bacterium]|nr:hypothetical protein [Acidobacteriota bacterium]
MKLTVLSVAVLLIAGPRILHSDDLENALQSLKEAESKKDTALVKKLAVETRALARRVASAPAPQTEDEKEAWTRRAAYARDIELYAEYALYAAAIQAPPAAMVDLLSTLELENPKSKYLDNAYSGYLLALNQTGAASKIPDVAEKAIAHFPDNEDLLLVLADTAMNRKQSDRALGCAKHLQNVLYKHAKPEGMSAADWQSKKNAALGRAHWIAGLVLSEKNQYYQADKDLRAALPLIRGNEPMLAPTLFYLGVVNYQLASAMRNKARMLEAAKFSDEAAAIKGPLAQQAWRNAQAMRAEAAKLR